MQPQCPKLRNRCIVAAREDDLEEIIKNVEGNLKEDAKYDVSEEGEIPPKEEENLNKSSGEDEEMYSWDELKYKANCVCFISNESTEHQVQIASAAVDKLEEPVYIVVIPTLLCLVIGFFF